MSDLVEGIWRLFNADIHEPVNLGNPEEYTIRALSDLVLATTDSASTIEVRPLPEDDPRMRSPDISLASARLDWTPRVPLEVGLKRTVEYFREMRPLGAAPE